MRGQHEIGAGFSYIKTGGIVIVKRLISAILLLFLLTAFSACDEMPGNEQAENNQSATSGIADLEDTAYFGENAVEHILLGEINRKNQAVGYHYEGLSDSEAETIPGTASKTNKYGVYTAKVRIAGIDKQSNGGRSTFFPKEWNAQDVINAINEAYENRAYISGNTYAGLSEDGMTIRMYLDDDEKIISAFPEY